MRQFINLVVFCRLTCLSFKGWRAGRFLTLFILLFIFILRLIFFFSWFSRRLLLFFWLILDVLDVQTWDLITFLRLFALRSRLWRNSCYILGHYVIRRCSIILAQLVGRLRDVFFHIFIVLIGISDIFCLDRMRQNWGLRAWILFLKTCDILAHDVLWLLWTLSCI